MEAGQSAAQPFPWDRRGTLCCLFLFQKFIDRSEISLKNAIRDEWDASLRGGTFPSLKLILVTVQPHARMLFHLFMEKLQRRIKTKMRWLDCKGPVVDSDTYSKKIFTIIS